MESLTNSESENPDAKTTAQNPTTPATPPHPNALEHADAAPAVIVKMECERLAGPVSDVAYGLLITIGFRDRTVFSGIWDLTI